MGTFEPCNGKLLGVHLSQNPSEGLEGGGSKGEGEERTAVFLRLVSDYSVWFKHRLVQL